MKTVVNSKQVTHLWANKVQSNARNANGSLFFNDSSIFSYGSHFLIAKHVTNSGGQNAVLFTTADYSKTTAKQKCWVRQSIPSAVQVFKIDLSGRFDHVTDDVVTEYNQRKEVILGKALRARSNREWYLQEVQSLHLETLRFVNFFGFDSALVTPLGFDAATLEASRVQRETYEAEKNAKRKQADLITYAEMIADWKAGRRVYGYMPSSIDTMLRLTADGQVETSRGATFPASHAVKGLRLVRSVVASGQEWKTNGHKLPLGHYQIDRITVDGTVFAGCHVVKLAEIERIAAELEAVSEVLGDCLEGCI
jgi:hypothetical protein